MDWPADQVERHPIDRLLPYARNARTHSNEQVAQIAASMKEWGWANPILIGWDEALLKIELAGLSDMAFDLSVIGFSGIEIETALGKPVDDPSWNGMPEFKKGRYALGLPYRRPPRQPRRLAGLFQLVEQPITEKTQFIWYPKVDRGRMTTTAM